ncbi:hypothetical protein MLD38_016197 [Melastoma candidum]|uniref:Uncharacterized protein n=1 Tax=Melastoma candidum TaxID=119954 RepID=A0ACB9RIH7_9MYRT|nr:hypothetical protein MLD38_016197 [Melastoma candidum]
MLSLVPPLLVLCNSAFQAPGAPAWIGVIGFSQNLRGVTNGGGSGHNFLAGRVIGAIEVKVFDFSVSESDCGDDVDDDRVGLFIGIACGTEAWVGAGNLRMGSGELESICREATLPLLLKEEFREYP